MKKLVYTSLEELGREVKVGDEVNGGTVTAITDDGRLFVGAEGLYAAVAPPASIGAEWREVAPTPLEVEMQKLHALLQQYVNQLNLVSDMISKGRK